MILKAGLNKVSGDIADTFCSRAEFIIGLVREADGTHTLSLLASARWEKQLRLNAEGWWDAVKLASERKLLQQTLNHLLETQMNSRHVFGWINNLKGN